MYLSFGVLLGALSWGILQSDPYYGTDYSPPPGMSCLLEDANKYFRKFLSPEDKLEILEISEEDLDHELKDFIENHPICRMWNEWGNPPEFAFTSMFTPMPSKRDFIDLSALHRNTMQRILDDEWHWQKFNEEFEKEWAATGTASVGHVF